MPKTSNTNLLMADYVSQAGLTRVYIGVQAQSKDTVSGPHEFQLLVLLSSLLKEDEYLGPNSPETCSVMRNYERSLL